MKYIIVTGSSGGIGFETVKLLIEKGYFVFGIDYIDNNYQNKLFKFIKCNVTNRSDIINGKNEILKVTNHIDAIYNIAGIFMLESLVEGKEEDFKKIFDVNFFGTYTFNKQFIELLDNKSRIIVFTSEVARYSPQPFNAYYALPKIVLDKYADILRRELNYLNIKVIKVQSGAIKTKLLLGVNDKYNEMVENSTYYKKPLTTLKSLMDDEINKQASPVIVANLLVKILEIKNPKILYKIRNSFKLRFLNSLPEKLQDFIYINVIK